MNEFWLRDGRDLVDIADVIAREFAAMFTADSEDRYEWFEGQSETEGLKFNISRAHTQSRSAPGNPVRIHILLSTPEFREPNFEVLGIRLARCLESDVAFGDVTYVGGDHFRFHELRVFPRAFAS
jgi:hypothetical protein